MKRTGGCQCGEVRYVCTGEEPKIYVCHCTTCRAQSASAFGISYIVPATSLQITHGTPHYYEVTTDSGSRKNGAFCPTCGVRLWHMSGTEDAYRSIKGGSLDEPLDLSKAIHIWVSSKLAGIIIPDGCRQFPKEPD